MSSFTRRLAAQLRPVLRRAQSRPRSPGPDVGFIGDKEGLIVRAVCDGVIIEHRAAARQPKKPFGCRLTSWRTAATAGTIRSNWPVARAAA